METTELKKKIGYLLDELDEASLLKVNEMITTYIAESRIDKHWDELSMEDQSAINEGLEQLSNGESLTREEVRAKINSRLSV